MHRLLRDDTGVRQAPQNPGGLFGLQNKAEGKLFGEDALAFLRHAYGQFYHDFANVDLKGATFHPQLTFSIALKSFRNAVL
eukprot:7379513-Prymnesium_polylepis.4